MRGTQTLIMCVGSSFIAVSLTDPSGTGAF